MDSSERFVRVLQDRVRTHDAVSFPEIFNKAGSETADVPEGQHVLLGVLVSGGEVVLASSTVVDTPRTATPTILTLFGETSRGFDAIAEMMWDTTSVAVSWVGKAGHVPTAVLKGIYDGVLKGFQAGLKRKVVFVGESECDDRLAGALRELYGVYGGCLTIDDAESNLRDTDRVQTVVVGVEHLGDVRLRELTAERLHRLGRNADQRVVLIAHGGERSHNGTCQVESDIHDLVAPITSDKPGHLGVVGGVRVGGCDTVVVILERVKHPKPKHIHDVEPHHWTPAQKVQLPPLKNASRPLAEASRVVISHLELDMFDDVALPLQRALENLGMPTVVEKLGIWKTPGTNVTLLEHDLVIVIGQGYLSVPQRHRYIVWNLEQQESDHLNERVLSSVASAVAVWDFSPRTVEWWRSERINAFFMPYGPFHWEFKLPPSHNASDPKNWRQTPSRALFFGSPCPRRSQVKQGILAAGLPVDFEESWGLWQDQRLRIIDEADLIVNIHCYPGAALETLRLMGVLSRSKAIISERSTDPELDAMLSECIELVPPFEEDEGALVRGVAELLQNKQRRVEYEEKALPCLRRVTPTQHDLLRLMM